MHFFHDRLGNLLLPSNALWTEECRGNILEIGQPDVSKENRAQHGSYVDNLLVKMRDSANHVTVLVKAFEVLRKYKMRLNPAKYAFGVSSEKFLGFLISQ